MAEARHGAPQLIFSRHRALYMRAIAEADAGHTGTVSSKHSVCYRPGILLVSGQHLVQLLLWAPTATGISYGLFWLQPASCNTSSGWQLA